MDELLREAACIGNLDAVHKLLEKGASINSQHKMNGWTALHWACKRGHVTVIEYLLQSGADVNLVSVKGESPLDVASDNQTQKLLARHGLDHGEMLTGKENSETSDETFVPNYLQHPLFPHYDIQKQLDRLCLNPATRVPVNNPTHPVLANQRTKKDVMADSDAGSGEEIPKFNHQKDSDYASACTVSSSVPTLSPPTFSSSSSSHPPSPLLVKVRVSGSGESDYVEVEVATPTYSALVSACCEELELVTSDVAKIRKLPNVLVRKDRDVQRMADGQELEVVLNQKDGN